MKQMLLSLFLFVCINMQMSAQKKPNIVVIMADDVGWSNLGCYGGDIMGTPTPNIDKIAKDGLKLTTYYAQASCTAGRSAFITGQLPVRTGLATVQVVNSPTGLRKEDPTLAEILKTAGYNTAQFGKNHLGDKDETLPFNHGFDVYWGNLYHLNANEVPFNDKDFPTDPAFLKQFTPRGIVSGVAGNPVAKDEGALTVERMKTYDDEILKHTTDWIKEKAKENKPFFVWYNPSKLHVFQHLQDKWVGSSRASKQGYDVYGDALAEHDFQVGELMKVLSDLKLDDNTIVIYTTDNGPYQYMWPEGGTTPFAGDKGTSWEGGVRVPCIVKWTGKVPEGTTNSEIFSSEDWFPTLAKLAGIDDVAAKLENGATFNGKQFKVLLEGVDQTNLILGKGKSNRNWYFYYDEATLTGVRVNQYKMTFLSKRNGQWDNYLEPYGRPLVVNLLQDPYERHTQSNVTRQIEEHEQWALLPGLQVLQKHLASFEKFPPRQKPLSGDFSKMVESFMSQMNMAKQKE